MSTDHDDPQTPSDDTPSKETPKENLVHFNPWRDFNDAAPQIDVFGDEPDPEQIAQFMEVVFGYSEGLIPVRSFIDKGQGIDGRPHNIWIEANADVADKMATFATWAAREGAAVYVIPEPPRNPASRTGDLWILGDHRLLCGDSTSETDVRRLMNGERAILFATDPPYLVDYDGSNHPTRNKDWSQSYGNTWDDSSQGAELYDGFISAAVAEAITDNAAWYCWHASRRQAMLEACWEKAGAFVHQQIIWVKDRGVLTRSHYLWKHEPCFMGWRRPNRPPKVAEQTLPSTWELPSFAKDERPDHPTPKPLDAFGIPMRQHVARGGVCYEPFAGSGSQIMAGEANGRRVFAMEISPAYVDVAVERWQAETGREAILDGDGLTFAEVKEERLGAAQADGKTSISAAQ